MLQSTTTQTITTTTVTTAAVRLRGPQYQTRAAQAEALKAVILAAGLGEPGRPSRLVTVEGEAAFAEVIAHPVGVVVRFHVSGQYGLKERELVILPHAGARLRCVAVCRR